MEHKDIKILICEDDKSLGLAIKEALQRAGYQTTLTTSVSEASQKIKSEYFLCHLIDCMLPDQNGINLANNIRFCCGDTPKIIFISGIFKNENFIKKTLDSTKATHFLKKPFNLQYLVSIVDECLKGQSDMTNLQKFIASFSPSYILKKNEIHGFNIPLLLTSIIEKKLSGFLELQSTKSSINGKIYFHKGSIFHVEINEDQETLFGQLFVKHNFISKSVLKEEIENNPDMPILGEHLVKNNLIPPSSIPVIMIEQIKERITHFIQNITYSINLIEEENFPNEININQETFFPFLKDLITTKVSHQWINDQLSKITQYFCYNYKPLKIPVDQTLHLKLKEVFQNNENLQKSSTQKEPQAANLQKPPNLKITTKVDVQKTSLKKTPKLKIVTQKMGIEKENPAMDSQEVSFIKTVSQEKSLKKNILKEDRKIEKLKENIIEEETQILSLPKG